MRSNNTDGDFPSPIVYNDRDLRWETETWSKLADFLNGRASNFTASDLQRLCESNSELSRDGLLTALELLINHYQAPCCRAQSLNSVLATALVWRREKFGIADELHDFKKESWMCLAKQQQNMTEVLKLLQEIMTRLSVPQELLPKPLLPQPRRRANISIRSAAYFAGVSDRTIRNWEKGTYPHPPNYPGRDVDMDTFKIWANGYRNTRLARNRGLVNRHPIYLPPNQLEEIAESEGPDHRFFDENQDEEKSSQTET